MMFALTVLRILLALSLVFVLCSSQKSFLKGLLIGSILGHKKGSMLHEGKGESKDFHHYEKEYYHPPPVEKEYVPVPVHEEPRFVPVYIVKECSKKGSGSYGSSGMQHHHHDHHHSYNYETNKLSDFESGYDSGYSADDGEYGYASASASASTSASVSKYKGTLDGYSESRYNQVQNEPNYIGDNLRKSQNNDNSVGVVLSVHKDYENKY